LKVKDLKLLKSSESS